MERDSTISAFSCQWKVTVFFWTRHRAYRRSNFFSTTFQFIFSHLSHGFAHRGTHLPFQPRPRAEWWLWNLLPVTLGNVIGAVTPGVPPSPCLRREGVDQTCSHFVSQWETPLAANSYPHSTSKEGFSASLSLVAAGSWTRLGLSGSERLRWHWSPSPCGSRGAGGLLIWANTPPRRSNPVFVQAGDCTETTPSARLDAPVSP